MFTYSHKYYAKIRRKTFSEHWNEPEKQEFPDAESATLGGVLTYADNEHSDNVVNVTRLDFTKTLRYTAAHHVDFIVVSK